MTLTPDIQEGIALAIVALIAAGVLWRRVRRRTRRPTPRKEATIHFHRRR